MELTLKKIFFSIPIVLSISLVLLMSSLNFFALSILSIIVLLSFVFFEFSSRRKILSFSVVFACLLFLFHFGQVLLLGLFPKYLAEEQITLLYFTESNAIHGSTIMLLVFSFILLGIIFFEKRSANKSIIYNKNDKSDFKIAKIIIYFTFPIKLFIDIYFLFLAIRYGTSISLNWLYSFPSFLITIGNFSLIGFGICIVKLKGKRQALLTFCILAYLALIMMSGRRSENVAYFCIFLLIFLMTRRINHKIIKGALIAIFGYLFLAFLYAIVLYRSNSAQSFVDLWNVFLGVLTKKNFFVEVLREYGNTGYTSICVTENYLVKNSPTLGSSYFLGITSVLPNLTGLPGLLTEKSNFAIQLRDLDMLMPQYRNIGGSLIGELLFNFGYFGGCIFAFIVGGIFSFFEEQFYKNANSQSIFKLGVSIVAMFVIFYWIRDTFSGGIRFLCWGTLFLYFLDRRKHRYVRRDSYAIQKTDSCY